MIIFFFFFFDEATGDTVPVPVDDRNVNNPTELELFFDNEVRRVWHKQEAKWYFSMIDVCSVLTDSSSPSAYWRKLKQRLLKSGNETVTNCHSLKLKATDGKMRRTDCFDVDHLLHIIPFIHSTDSSAFLHWLSNVSRHIPIDGVISIDEASSSNYTESLFDSIRHVNEYGQEFWYARELQIALDYKEWRNFNKVIEKAKIACEGSENNTIEHFVEVNKTIDMPKNATKMIEDYNLSRYACYLIVQNANPRKKLVALGQSYFAIKTRQQELIENYEQLTEDQKRLAIRKEMLEHNKLLVSAAKDAGVETSMDYAIFQNYGYIGLYGGLKAADIKRHKGLKKNEQILDYMGYEELAANLFRATQAEAKLKRENIQGKDNANQAHFDVGQEVRNTIKRLGGTMPEDLPTPEKSIKQIEREQGNLGKGRE